MTDRRHALGLAAEEAAAAWLAHRGWRIVARRVRPRGGGELDIVAIDPDGVLVAVEVRARRTSRAGAAADSVDVRRMARLRRGLAAVALAGGARHHGLRVDLLTAEPVEGSRWRLRRLPAVG